MAQFDILDRHLNIHRSYFLEASAGTGKTFSIENLFTRLILESPDGKEPLLLPQILAVTFTRAATREMRQRIRSYIASAVDFLSDRRGAKQMPDYLLHLCEQGDQVVLLSKRRLERALASFDEAQIFTLHGFCYRMLQEYALEGDVGFQLSSPEDEYPASTLLMVVRDFLRSGILLGRYTPSQLRIVLAHCRHDGKQLEKSLVRAVTRYMGSAEEKAYPLLSFEEIYERFIQGWSSLQKHYPFSEEELRQHFARYLLQFKGTHSNKGELKPDFAKGLDQFSQLFCHPHLSKEGFESLLLTGCKLWEALEEKNRKAQSKKNGDTPLSCEAFFKEVSLWFIPFLRQAVDPQMLLRRMAKDCACLLTARFREEEKWTPDELLNVMHRSLNQPEFIKRIAARYGAVIIDEFQDTDPIQWEIFSRCFFQSSKTCHCYLVGDPKQSIYAFRNADIYTYLRASQLMGDDARASLDTNFRSQPKLVDALNALFCHPRLASWMALPKLQKGLAVQPVKASPLENASQIEDGRGSVHFFVASGSAGAAKQWPSKQVEESYFFPFLAREILALRQKEGLDFRACAILVRDRYQAERLQCYLRSCLIPSMTRKSRSLVTSPVVNALEQLLQAIENPTMPGYLRTALGGSLLRWDHHRLRTMEEHIFEAHVIDRFFFLKEHYLEKGVVSFFETLMSLKLLTDQESVAEKILSAEEGSAYYRELRRLVELIAQQELCKGVSLAKAIQFLKELKLRDSEEEPFQIPPEEDDDAVQILTIHISKGLEFEIVFALGLANATRRDEEPSQEDGCMGVEEADAEKMRQLYVAMTRAKKRLYVPIAIEEKRRPVPYGTASPIDLFCAYTSLKEDSYAGLYRNLGEFETFFKHLDELALSSDITYAYLEADQGGINTLSQDLTSKLLPPPPLALSFPSCQLTSYSALSKTLLEGQVKGPVNLKSLERETKEREADSLLLPPGPETGILVHELLRQIPFAAWQQASDLLEVEALCLPLLKTAPLLAKGVRALSEILYAAMQAPIEGRQGSRFSLKEISPLKIMREAEFFVADGQERLMGYIDLFFEHEGFYYLLDWKMNDLGRSNGVERGAADYAKSQLELAMKQHHYELQAQIYTKALRRYLTLVEKRPFEECFGGAIYFFLRGAHHPPHYGIYQILPEMSRNTEESNERFC